MTAQDPTGPTYQPVCIADVEQLAAERMQADVWDFVTGGCGDESALTANRRGLDRVRLVPRVLAAGTGAADTSGQMVGCEAAMPVVVAPMAYQRLVHPEGELGSAYAARAAGVPFVVPMLSSYRLEEIAKVGAVTWLQLYWLRDRDAMIDLLGRAEQAGCAAVVATVDVPFVGRRLRDLRNGFTLPPSVTAANFSKTTTMITHVRRGGASAIAAHSSLAFDPMMTWADVGWLRERTRLPIVVKGVLDPRDAVIAVDSGATAVVVSNHGGRQFEGAIPSITALRPVAEAVNGRCEVLFDSGVRTGTDILRALALGADAVLCGRPVLWGLALDGGAGAAMVLDLLQTELSEALLLSGCGDLVAARGLATVLL